MNPRFEQLGIAISQALGVRATPAMIVALGELAQAIGKVADLMVADTQARIAAAAASAHAVRDPSAPTGGAPLTVPVAMPIGHEPSMPTTHATASTTPTDAGPASLPIPGFFPPPTS